MGTSLSGLTPATTFDGLLKTSDNDGLTTTLKRIGAGDGTDSQLQIATNATQLGNIQFVSSNVITPVSPSTALRITTPNGGTAINKDYSAPTANTMLHIKGSGATSATTSLLVQNSEGTELLKINDDGDINMLPNTKTLTIGSRVINGGEIRITPNNQSSIQWQGSNGIMYMSGRGKGIFLGDTSATPTARLHIKGSGNDNTTTSLLVQNSDGTELMKVDDAGTITAQFEGQAATGLTISGLGSNTTTIGAGVTTDFTSSNIKAGGSLRFAYDTVNKYVTIGSGSVADAGVRLQVKGSGATSATTALLVQNSAGTDLLKVADDGSINMSAFRQIRGGSSSYSITLQGTTAMQFTSWAKDFVWTTQNGTIATLKNDGKLGLGENTPTAKLQVKGSGATSATTALLVQNSAGTDLFKVADDKRATFSGIVEFQSNAQLRGAVDSGSTLLNLRFVVSGASKSFLINADYSNTNDPSALLEVQSTTKGFLPPKMTTTQRDAITSPAAGLMVYNTTTNKAQCYNGTTWNDLF